MMMSDICLSVSGVPTMRGESMGGEGSIAQALWERLVGIQEGRVEWEGW
jgi:hypothetical protein